MSTYMMFSSVKVDSASMFYSQRFRRLYYSDSSKGFSFCTLIMLFTMMMGIAFAQNNGKPELNKSQLAPLAMPKYVGPGSCAASACHGGVQPQTVTHVLQNEYSVWVVQDKHNKAYRSLLDPISQRMAKLLGINAPEKSPKCLACHALYVPEEQRGRDIDITEGVSCENCHGAA